MRSLPGILLCLAAVAPLSALADTSVQVSAPGVTSQSPDVAIGPDGSVNVVWLGANVAKPNPEQIAKVGHSHDSATNLFFARSTDGGATFSTPARVNRTDGDVWGFSISKPRIAAGPDGRVHILFPGNATNAKTGASETVALYLRSSADVGAFEPARRLNVDALADALDKDDGGSFATLSVDDRNTVHAAWIDTREITGGEKGRLALATSIDGGASFAPDRVLLPAIVCPCCQLSSTIGAQRRLLLGLRLVDGPYRDNEILAVDDAGHRIEWRRRVSGTRWAIEGCPRKPTVVVARGRTIAAAYYSAPEQPEGVYVVRSGDGGATWSAPLPLHPAAARSDAPALVFAGRRLYAVWQAREGNGDLRLFESHSDDDGRSFTSPFELPIPPGVARMPAVGAHADGSLQVVWQHAQAIRALRWRPAQGTRPDPGATRGQM